MIIRIAIILVLISNVAVFCDQCAGASIREPHSCAIRSLYSSVLVNGHDVSIDKVRQVAATVPDGQCDSLDEIAVVAEQFGLFTLAIRLPKRELTEVPPASILHLQPVSGPGHFVTVIRSGAGSCIIGDAPREPYSISVPELEACSGNVLLVFNNDSDRSAYLRRIHFAGRVVMGLMACVIVCLFPLLWTSRRCRRVIGFGVIALAYAGCSPAASSNRDEVAFEAKPSLQDIGYVPVEGTKVTTDLYNRSHLPIEIKGTRTNCSCTKVECPESIPPNGRVNATVSIRGDVRPTRKAAVVTFETKSGASCSYTVRYDTGEVPSLHPSHIALAIPAAAVSSKEAVPVGAATLWIRCRRGDRFTLKQGEIPITILHGTDYTLTEDENEADITANGIAAIRLQIAPVLLSGSGRVMYSCGGEAAAVSFNYSVPPQSRRFFAPDAQYLKLEDGVERVFVGTAPFPFKPRILQRPDWCDVSLVEVSSRQWKLRVSVKSEDLDSSIDSFSIDLASVRDDTNLETRETCTIHVVR